MQAKRNRPRSSPRTTSRPARLELPPDRAFVLHLDAHAQPPRRVVGRVEHVISGQVTHVTSLRGLMAFLAKVLRNQVRVERERANATFVAELCQGGDAATAQDPLDDDAARSAIKGDPSGSKRS